MGCAPAEVTALSERLDQLDYYEVLDISPATPASGVKRAYYAISRRFHPDANRSLDAEDRLCLERIARRVAEAYSVLRDARRRKAYDEHIGSTGPLGKRIRLAEAEAQAGRQAMEDHLGKTPNGRRYFTLARSDLERGDLRAAANNLQMALTFEPANQQFKDKLEEIRAQLR